MRVNKDVTLRVRVPSDLAAKIDAIAGVDGVNRSEIIRRIVGSFCAEAANGKA
jgi:metal-responsive CopG/Arc/MetJ family transcriptional regulator